MICCSSVSIVPSSCRLWACDLKLGYERFFHRSLLPLLGVHEGSTLSDEQYLLGCCQTCHHGDRDDSLHHKLWGP